MKLVANGRMRVGEVLGSPVVLGSETVQVRHGLISNHFGIAVILLENQNHMAKLRDRTG
jgi:hypothetical protein